MVNCDSSHIRQIVGNLLSNALKFTFHGKVFLEVEYRPGNLHISVLDTGMGIGLEEKKRIFGAFERLDNARNIPGFGLGLAITARLVSLMQGHVEVESVPGEGSRFLFSCLCYRPDTPSVRKRSFLLFVNCPLISVCWSLMTTVSSWESSVKCFPVIRFTVTAARMSGS